MPKSVKTAVSLPAEIFERAEALRRRKRKSRSGLYSAALEAFLKAEEIREKEARYEAGYRKHPEDPAELEPLLRLSLEALPKEDW